MIEVREIINATAALSGLRSTDLLALDRRQEVVRPRQRAMYLARRLRPELSYPLLGKIFAGRDHTTVLWAERRVEGRLIGGDNQERAEICTALAHLGLPDDLDAAVEVMREALVQDNRLSVLKARRAVLQMQLEQTDRQIARLQGAGGQ